MGSFLKNQTQFSKKDKKCPKIHNFSKHYFGFFYFWKLKAFSK